MAFVNGLQARITAAGATTDLGFFINTATKPYLASIDLGRAVADSTGFGSTPPEAMEMIAGINEWTGSFTAKYPKTAPAMGEEGLVTFANGYVLGANAWTMSAAITEHEETGFAPTPPAFRAWSPGLYTLTGSWTCQVDDGNALDGLTDAAGTGAADFRLAYNGGTNSAILKAANIIVTGRSTPFEVNGKPLVTYSFVVDGVLQCIGANTLWSIASPTVAENITVPSAETITLRMDDAGDREMSGSAFCTGWTTGCAIGSPVEHQVNFRGTGALTDT